MEVNEISGVILDRAVKIHQALRPELSESVYQRILAYQLRKAGLQVETHVPIQVEWDGHVIDHSFQADLVGNGLVLIELKSIEETKPAHRKQTLNQYSPSMHALRLCARLPLMPHSHPMKIRRIQLAPVNATARPDSTAPLF